MRLRRGRLVQESWWCVRVVTVLFAAAVTVSGSGSGSNWGAQAYEVGVNWGTQASHPLPAKAVVKLLQENNVTRVKLFDSDATTLDALAGSNIQVMVAIPNKNLQAISSSADSATAWVKQNVARYIFQGGVNISHVAVGNEPFLSAYNGTFVNLTFPALNNIQNALNAAGFGDSIKTTVPMNADVLTDAAVPSEGAFVNATAQVMAQILDLLHRNGCPFTVNIYPFISLYANPNFPQNYLHFDSNVVQIQDGAYAYTNAFDATFDTLLAALTAAGYPDMPIILGEIGWPTDGHGSATPANAQRFVQGFLRHVQSDAGTPRRPNASIFFYLFGLLDEDQKSIDPGNFERHWGVFAYDGSAKYPLSLRESSGSGTSQLVNASGVQYLPRRWCVVSDSANLSALAEPVSYACTFADCTELAYGASCNAVLDSKGNASYAFNQYFQLNNQASTACSFQGAASITTTDPSVGTCKFIVQLAVKSAGSTAESVSLSLIITVLAAAVALLLSSSSSTE